MQLAWRTACLECMRVKSPTLQKLDKMETEQSGIQDHHSEQLTSYMVSSWLALNMRPQCPKQTEQNSQPQIKDEF